MESRDAAEDAIAGKGRETRPADTASQSTRRQIVIAVLVALHFSLGLLATLPPRSLIWAVPLLPDVCGFYLHSRLDQSWSMFAPPPRVNSAIHYAVEFSDGWTDLVPLQKFASDQAMATLVQSRGIFRLMTFLRSTHSDQIPGGLKVNGERAFYYQHLADFFCVGDGRIPGAVTIRFYLVGHRAPYFFDTDRFGGPQPPITDYHFQRPLYEQSCSPP